MATPRQYWNALRSTRNKVALAMGIDIDHSSKDARAVANANLAVIVVLVKALTDSGVLTDAQLLAAQTSIENAAQWDDEPTLP